MRLSVALRDLAVCRLGAQEEIPRWVNLQRGFVSVTRTRDELSIVCSASAVPPGVRYERGWAAIRLEGPIDLAQAGVLAPLLMSLAEAAVPVFAISTFDTDHVLVRESMLRKAKSVLERSGHIFQ